MKKAILIGLLVPHVLFAQLTDDFSDGDFTNSPAWFGGTSFFTVNANELQLNAPPDSLTAYLYTNGSATLDSAEWQFFTRFAFAPSSTNFTRIYLVSDNSNLEQALNGYYVQLGETGSSDAIELFEQTGTTSVSVVRGAIGAIANSFNVRVKVTRDSAGNWSLFADYSGGNDFQLQGTGTNTVHISGSFFGVYCKYTTSRFNAFFYDDFYAGPVIGDTSPPVINSISVTSISTLDVIFNEAVEKNSSESILNYSANNGIGNPATATRDAGDSSVVHLAFPGTFQNGIVNILTVVNVSDLNGNAISSQAKDFLYFVPDIAGERDVIINEIFPDPDPTVGLPAVEFIELYNRSQKVFELNTWTFSDGTSNTSLGNFTLLPNSYLILCPTGNVNLFSGFGNTLGVGSFPSLNNTDDDLTLHDNNGLLIDRATYSDTWYDDITKQNGGWTLERIDPDYPCNDRRNWAASNDASGGTPGIINSINGTVTDTTTPGILSVELLSSDSLKVVFTEIVESAQAANASNYSINSGIGNPSVVSVLSGTEVILVFSSSFNTGIVFTLTINGISDCIGNLMQNAVIDFAIPQSANWYDVLITEIFADTDSSVGLPVVEFVELFNSSIKTISLEKWSFSEATSPLPSYLLLPGNYLILCPEQNVNDYLPFGNALGLSGWATLTNEGEELSLTDVSGNTIFYISYSDSWYRDVIKKEGGWSLEMIDTENPCSGTSNWRASQDARGGTPGQVNSVNGVNPDEITPTLNYVLVQDSQSLLVVFDETLDSNAQLNTNYVIDNGITVAFATFANVASNEVLLLISPSLQHNIVYTLMVNNASDCSGNTIGVGNTAQFGIPETPDSFDLAINEILSNPVSGGSDFIELYNRSQKIIDLKDVFIASIDDEDGDTSAAIISTRGFQLLPGNYVALTDDPQNVATQYYTPNPKSVIDVTGMPSFDDDEDIVAIFNRLDNNSVIDAVHYFDDWNFALIDDLDGVSLERINYNSASQDKNNWHSAASTVGYATPAYQNSQFGESASATSTITIEPKTFSPNNDGYEDVLNVRYKLDQPGYVANIDIYDDDGRKIHELINNLLLDVEGNIVWDGVNDDNEKARIGVYIVIIELFNLSGDVKKFKESCVLAGKL